MENKKSIILEVDEATRGLIDRLSDEIAPDISGPISSLKGEFTTTQDMVNRVLKKLSGFDSINVTVEELRDLAEESRELLEQSSSIEEEFNSTRTTIAQETEKIRTALVTSLEEKTSATALLIKVLSEDSEKRTSVLSSTLEKILDDNDNLKTLLIGCNESITKIQSSVSTLSNTIDNITVKQDLIYSKVEQVSSILNSLQASVATRDDVAKITSEIENINQIIDKKSDRIESLLSIVINLVTPFWKKSRIKELTDNTSKDE